MQAGTPINSTAAFELLEDIQRHLQDAADPTTSSVTYFGQEIKTLFQIGETVLEHVENSTDITDVERLTESTFQIFELLKHASPWEELTHVRQSFTRSFFSYLLIASTNF